MRLALIVAKNPLSATMLRRGTVLVCVLQLLGASAIAQPQTSWLLAKDEMSWKDILGKAGPAVSQPTQEPSSRQPPVSALILPKLSGRVVDEANLLDQATRVILTDKLAQLEAKTSDRLIVLTLKSLQGTSIEEFIIELGQYWQIFQSHGSHEALVMVALNERKVHIHVGYRLQSTLTNAIAQNIIDKSLVPRFTVNDFAGGISNAVDDIIHVLMPNSPESVGQSFDCKSAKHPNEKLICQSTELSKLDDRMVAVFDTLMNLLNSGDRQQLRTHQREWLKDRLDCDDDFICTKRAYTERIERLNSVLAKVRNNTNTNQPAQCRVSDPNPPLNVRTTPNGSIVGTLSNGTLVTVLDYSPNKPWVYVGRYEDRFPIGWVYREYLDCMPSNRNDSSSLLPRFTSYICYVLHDFQVPQKPDKDPVIETTVIVTDDDRLARFRGIEVQHKLQSGMIHKRHEQYRNYRTSIQTGREGASWNWTGVLASNPAISMKGGLVAGESGTVFYTERLTANGKLDSAGIWSCYTKNEGP